MAGSETRGAVQRRAHPTTSAAIAKHAIWIENPGLAARYASRKECETTHREKAVQAPPTARSHVSGRDLTSIGTGREGASTERCAVPTLMEKSASLRANRSVAPCANPP